MLGVGAKIGDSGTNRKRRLGTGVGERNRCHRGCSCLTVCTGDSQDLLFIHSGGKALRAMVDRHTGSFCGLTLRVVGTSYGGGNDDVDGTVGLYLCSMKVLGFVANVNGSPAFT